MIFVGLDHSLTAFGVAAVPSGWEQDFRRVRRVTLKTAPGEAVARRAALARDLVNWLNWLCLVERAAPAELRVFIEGGIFMRGKAETIRSQERLAGVVEHELGKVGLRVAVAEQRAVRSLFMGRSLSVGRGAGDAAQALLQAMLPRASDWHEAELDAFLVANFGLSEAGELFLSCAPERVSA